MTKVSKRAEAVRLMLAAGSVAVVGASSDPLKVGYRPVDNLVRHGYEGRVYPINPRLDECQGLRCYPSLSALPEVPDVVAIVVAAARVPEILDEAGLLGVPSVVVISSGFSESDAAGRVREDEVAAVAVRHGITLCGPNSLGFIHRPTRLALTFAESLTQGELTRSGSIGIVSQSGAFGTVMYALARDMDLGLRTFISSGNEATLGIADFIAALVEDPGIGVVGGYVESLRRGSAFAAAALEARRRDKPIVLVKVGASEGGRVAAASHTGALAGDDRVYEAAFRRFGVVRAVDEQHLLDALDAFDTLQRLPTGSRVAVVTTSGGAGVLMCDELERRGLRLAEFSDEFESRLRELLPPFAAVGNPVDLTGQFVADTSGLSDVLEAIATLEGVDAVLFFTGLGWSAKGAWVDAVVEIAASGAPLLIISPLATLEQRTRLRTVGIPTYASPRQGVQVLESLVQWTTWRRCEGELSPIEPSWFPPPGFVSETDTKKLLRSAGLRTPRGRVVTSAEEARRASAELGGRVALKIQIDGLTHKTDVGGVEIDIQAADAVETYKRMIDEVGASQPGAHIDGVLVEEVIDGAVEVAIGAVWREPFGHLVMVGLGGRTLELFGDVAFSLCPVGPGAARALLESLEGFPLLTGYRGAPHLDVDALAIAVSTVSRLCAGFGPWLQELDLNPVRVLPEGQGVVVLDAVAVVTDAGSSAR